MLLWIPQVPVLETERHQTERRNVNGPVKRCPPLSVHRDRGRQKRGIRVTALVAVAGCGCTDVCWDRLCSDGDPLAPERLIALAGEFQGP